MFYSLFYPYKAKAQTAKNGVRGIFMSPSG
jgi:hypothetical protein